MSRKCEDQMIAAVRAALEGRRFSQPGGNTEVRIAPASAGALEMVQVFLHGNQIAKFGITEGGVVVAECCLAGWNTVTTRSRINALARAFGAPVLVFDR